MKWFAESSSNVRAKMARYVCNNQPKWRANETFHMNSRFVLVMRPSLIAMLMRAYSNMTDDPLGVSRINNCSFTSLSALENYTGDLLTASITIKFYQHQFSNSYNPSDMSFIIHDSSNTYEINKCHKERSTQNAPCNA